MRLLAAGDVVSASHVTGSSAVLRIHSHVSVCRQVMKESKGRVNPAVMNKILMQKLNAK